MRFAANDAWQTACVAGIGLTFFCACGTHAQRQPAQSVLQPSERDPSDEDHALMVPRPAPCGLFFEPDGMIAEDNCKASSITRATMCTSTGRDLRTTTPLWAPAKEPSAAGLECVEIASINTHALGIAQGRCLGEREVHQGCAKQVAKLCSLAIFWWAAFEAHSTQQLRQKCDEALSTDHGRHDLVTSALDPHHRPGQHRDDLARMIELLA
ncbi:hypothetical protein QTI66_37875 [Variovorax sp. J22R133]|uniref:hypothetical protein n=1 Tax=Variovorax brevis TaxID=3053503 RepID=UPI00257855F9|nr:hypothetical protein [Variovorax sp. J22R133]MDM0117867.1 hypothetical protein [Variovorax sp. J22R133]